MIPSRCLLIGLLLCLTGCPKRGATHVAGSDEDQLDQDSAKLEELAGRVKAADLPCGDWCQMAKEVCELSRRVCDIAGRHADRQEVQRKCVSSQEQCAQFNDHCAQCSSK